MPSKPMAADADPAFEVATIKPGDPNPTSAGFHSNGRHVSAENQSLNSILSLAYGIHVKQIVGAPEWFATDRWNINGVADAEGEPSLKQMQRMYQKLLADRFKLVFHREKREMSVYAITVAKGGPKLAKSTGDPNGSGDENGAQRGTEIALKFTNASMADFVLNMEFDLDRPMVDQTGLAGRFDFKLTYTFDETRAGNNAAPGLFTAMPEQLGLKLEPVKAPAEVLVIDHVEKPSEN